LVPLSKCTGDSGITHPLSDLLVTSGESRRGFQLVEQDAQLSGAGKQGAPVSGGDKQEARAWGAGATGNEEAEIRWAAVPEAKADKRSRANR